MKIINLLILIFFGCVGILLAQSTEDCCTGNGKPSTAGNECCGTGQDSVEHNPKDSCCINEKVRSKTISTVSDLSKCPNKVAKKNYTPTTNGCGTDDFHVTSKPGGCVPCNVEVDFLPACDAHDICYGTCNTKKSNCDTNFHSAMINACESELTDQTCHCGELASRLNGCKKWANTYKNAVASTNSPFNNAQVNACQCCK